MPPKNHSKLGIISFIVSLLPIFLIGIPNLIDTLFPIIRQSALYGEFGKIIAQAINLFFPTLSLSIATGVAGLLQKNCKKTFAKAGLIISIAQLLVVALIYIWAENQHFS